MQETNVICICPRRPFFVVFVFVAGGRNAVARGVGFVQCAGATSRFR